MRFLGVIYQPSAGLRALYGRPRLEAPRGRPTRPEEVTPVQVRHRQPAQGVLYGPTDAGQLQKHPLARPEPGRWLDVYA